MSKTKDKSEVLENPEDPYTSDMIGFPESSEQIRGVDVVEKSKWCKRELNQKYPETKFRKSSEKYAGGSSFTVSWTNGPAEKEVKKIVDKYSDRGKHHNPQLDMTDVDNYAHVDREVTEDVKDRIAGQLARMGEDVDDYRLWALVAYISLDEDGHPVEVVGSEYDLKVDVGASGESRLRVDPDVAVRA